MCVCVYPRTIFLSTNQVPRLPIYVIVVVNIRSSYFSKDKFFCPLPRLWVWGVWYSPLTTEIFALEYVKRKKSIFDFSVARDSSYRDKSFKIHASLVHYLAREGVFELFLDTSESFCFVYVCFVLLFYCWFLPFLFAYSIDARVIPNTLKSKGMTFSVWKRNQ